jgi:primosomal protein N' (replication factor Y)
MSENHTPVADVPRRFDAGAEIAVLLPLPLAGAYDYRVADGLAVATGDLVEVPLGTRRLIGVVAGPAAGAVGETRLKPIRRRVEAPPLPAVSLRFVEWVAAYTVASPGSVLKMTIPTADALEPPKPALGYVTAAAPARPTPARTRVLAIAAEGPARPAVELAREAGVGVGVVRALIADGALVARPLRRERSPPAPDWRRPGPALSAAQAAAADRLRTAAGAGFSVSLLDGVAGAGKTEVYFEAIAAAMAAGRQSLVLLPEIALGAQWLERFARRFGAEPAVWHSELGAAVRRRTWRAVAEGATPVVVGARSALFLPFPRLGLIVVDEEHDPSFKQEDGVTYHARDMAVVRARLSGIPAVLVSATPSLETMVNARSGRYRLLHLPDRHAGVPPPAIEVLDLRADPPPRGGFLAPALRTALEETLAGGAQALLFLNRRGYAPLTLCRRCGHRLHCPSCTAWLVEHRLPGRLQCHHCGFFRPIPPACPDCGAEASLVACGPGVERLAEEVGALLPAARLLLATSDTLTGPTAAAELVRRIEAHEVDVIVGTQIVAKGYHFPLLTLVGVVDADLGLSGGDLRAAERTFQLLAQVAGRAGRGARPGRVLLQTHMPGHPVVRALATADRDRFLAAEEEERRATGMPPFGRLAALIVSGTDEASVDAAARALARGAPRIDGVRILGPAPAPLAVLRGRHRRRLLLHAPAGGAVSGIVRRWLRSVRVAASVRVQVDIDPIGFL